MKPLHTLLFVCSFSIPLAAQDYPHPRPEAAHKVLANGAGTWDAVVKMYVTGPTAPPIEYAGLETVKLVGGGLYSQSAFNCQMGERNFEGHGLLGYDPRSQEYKGLWVDNFSSVPTEIRGKYDADARTMTMFGVVVDPESGNELKQKQVTTYLDEKTKTFWIFLVLEIEQTKTEIKLMEMTLTKRG